MSNLLMMQSSSGSDEAPANPRGAERLTVLLVEDDPDVRETTATLIAELGHEVVVAASAEEAALILKLVRPDVLMTDITLPGISGEVLAAEARAGHSSIAIVFVTGRADIHVPKVAGFGPLVLRKPFAIEELESVLATLAAR